MRTAGSGPTVLVTTHYWHPHTGGIETVAAAHARELVDRGWTVNAHTSRAAGSAARDGQAPRHSAEGALSITRHRMANPLERWLNVPVPLPAPGLRRRLMADASRADIVVAHGHVYPITVAAARAARAARRPFVVVQHSPWVEYPWPVEMVERAADRAVGRRVLEFADLVVCVSAFTEDFVRRIAPRSTTTVITNGVDTDRFVLPSSTSPSGTGERSRSQALDSSDGSSSVDAPPLRFVAVRRLVPRTGVDVLVEAWRRAGLGSSAELIIAGAGPARDELERSAAGLAGIRFVGRVDDDEVVRLMQTANATVVPTRSGEGFGLVAAESHACGTPVIATDQGALREVVRDEVDGVLVPPNDPAALAATLTRFVADDLLRARLTAGARTTDWSWHRVGDQIDSVLRGLVGAHGTE